MADNVAITAGSGTIIRTDDVSGVQYQYVKLDVGGDGVSLPVSAAGANYVPVIIGDIASGVQFTIVPAASQTFPVVNAPTTTLAISASAAIPVSAVVASPVFVRLSDGTNPIATLPVSGTVTANQGTAAAASAPWPILLCDASSHSAAFTNYTGSSYALNVAIVSQIAGAGVQVDNTTFTIASGSLNVIGATYNDGAANPSSGQAAALRMTQLRGLHINIRKNDGTELGIAATPLRVDPTGTTTQPVSGTISAEVTKVGGSSVSTAASGIQKVGIVDGSGNAFSDTNPQTVQISSRGRTRVTNSVALSASQTAQAIWTPASGKKFVAEYMSLAVTTAGPLKFFDGSDSAGNRLTDSGSANWPTGIFNFDMAGFPFTSATADNVLKYTSGSGLVGVLTVHGYEV